MSFGPRPHPGLPHARGRRPGRHLLALALALAFAACAAPEPPEEIPQEAPPAPVEAPAPAPPPPPARTVVPIPEGPLHGVDVSGHQGDVDWQALADAGLHFVYIKATEGIDFKDPGFEKHWQGAWTAGLLRGAYHFFQPLDDGGEQARFFLSTVDHRPGDLVPVVDVEISKDAAADVILAELKEWLDVVEADLGVKPKIYTDVNFWNGLGAEGFEDYPLWVAEYGVEEPALPEGWESWTIWQYSRKGSVPGIEGDVDKSRSSGPLAVLPGDS